MQTSSKVTEAKNAPANIEKIVLIMEDAAVLIRKIVTLIQ